MKLTLQEWFLSACFIMRFGTSFAVYLGIISCMPFMSCGDIVSFFKRGDLTGRFIRSKSSKISRLVINSPSMGASVIAIFVGLC